MKPNAGVNLNKELTLIMKSMKIPKTNHKRYDKSACCHNETHCQDKNINLKHVTDTLRDFIKTDNKVNKKSCCSNKEKMKMNKIAIGASITALAVGAIGVTAFSVHNKNKKSYKYKVGNYFSKATKLAKNMY